MGPKRTHAEMSDSKDAPTSNSPFMPMFEAFRQELDEHHDRRERVIKASRDVTAASKKIIFTLQRVRQLQQAPPAHVTKGNKQYHDTITTQLSSIAPDLQGINAYRYARQISGGCQEYIEAASFQHYLETASLLSYDDACRGLREISSKPANSVSSGAKQEADADADTTMETDGAAAPAIGLSHEDYVLGIYDMTGELMRFAITAMATNQALPAIGSDRNVLTDMRALRSALEGLECGHGPFAKDAEKKAEVMRQSVEKVERALYGLTVRGAERPKGWMPDFNASAGVEVEG